MATILYGRHPYFVDESGGRVKRTGSNFGKQQLQATERASRTTANWPPFFPSLARCVPLRPHLIVIIVIIDTSSIRSIPTFVWRKRVASRGGRFPLSRRGFFVPRRSSAPSRFSRSRSPTSQAENGEHGREAGRRKKSINLNRGDRARERVISNLSRPQKPRATNEPRRARRPAAVRETGESIFFRIRASRTALSSPPVTNGFG